MIVYPNAKINIGLNVIERRTDGYHTIETVFYPIGIQDVLSVEPSEICSDYSFSVSGIEVGGNPEDNLVIKALHLLRQEYEFPPVDISLKKQIPTGAGLGGGSSDAAFMLMAINELFTLDISNRKLQSLASKLGSDCSFFIKNKPVFATGTGNKFSSLRSSLQGKWLLLVKPDIHVSTAEAYAEIVPSIHEISLKEQIQQPISEWKRNITNDFEKTVFKRFPEIASIKQKMYDLGAVYASMSGSGSSVYGIFDEKPVYDNLFANQYVACGELE
jgi:4-diphosphocytidyl-2-C-methyl-D-erythritol kinase